MLKPVGSEPVRFGKLALSQDEEAKHYNLLVVKFDGRAGLDTYRVDRRGKSHREHEIYKRITANDRFADVEQMERLGELTAADKWSEWRGLNREAIREKLLGPGSEFLPVLQQVYDNLKFISESGLGSKDRFFKERGSLRVRGAIGANALARITGKDILLDDDSGKRVIKIRLPEPVKTKGKPQAEPVRASGEAEAPQAFPLPAFLLKPVTSRSKDRR